MSKIRSLPRFCIGLSAAALLTLGLAGQAQSESRFQSQSSLHATFQDLANATREHQEGQANNPGWSDPETYSRIPWWWLAQWWGRW